VFIGVLLFVKHLTLFVVIWVNAGLLDFIEFSMVGVFNDDRFYAGDRIKFIIELTFWVAGQCP
jgi:hypothetical protein